MDDDDRQALLTGHLTGHLAGYVLAAFSAVRGSAKTTTNVAAVEPFGDIKLGTILFTMVEPHRGHEVAYNRWYERDHFYAGCMVARYGFGGDRFVATSRLKALRYPVESPMTPDPATGSYLALYWVQDGHHEAWNRWSVDTVLDLHKNGRMFTERTHIHTSLYTSQWSWTRTDTGTPIELALDRNYAGLVVNVGELAEGATMADVEAWTRTWADGTDAASGPDLIGASTPIPLLADAPADVPRIPNIERRFLQLHFIDRDPEQGWDECYAGYGDALNASGLATHLWTGAFINTVFGTDTYTDELW